eukprot:16431958-Heterocapsa_arctica.AAC.2
MTGNLNKTPKGNHKVTKSTSAYHSCASREQEDVIWHPMLTSSLLDIRHPSEIMPLIRHGAFQ